MTAALAGAPTRNRPPLRMLVRPAPHREPPFDDEILEPSPVGPYDRCLPFERPPQPAPFNPVVRPDGLPDPTVWARRLMVGLIETAAGRRPVQQLAPMLSMSVGRGLGADLERTAAASQRHWLHRASLMNVRGCEPAPGIAELCATVEIGRRVRAIALRLEEHHGHWRCTRLQLG